MTEGADPRIAVVCGGDSAEAEVSRVSGKGVADALRATYPDVEVFELDHRIQRRLVSSRIDVVFPVLHGGPGEDGTFQGFLETSGFPFVGSSVHACAYAMNKVVAKRLFRARGLTVADEEVVHRDDNRSESVRRVVERLGAEVVVKPSGQGSALGVHFASSAEQLSNALEQAFQLDPFALVEQRIRGKEITVAILEQPDPTPLPVTEVTTPKGSWYDYEHRYTPGLSEHIIPAPLPEDQYRKTQQMAVEAHLALGCRDLSRVDFVVPEGGDPVLLEVNTIPGMTPVSLYPDAAAASGVSFEALTALLVRRALSRGTGKSGSI